MDKAGFRYFIINKPDNIVSQFVSTHKVGLLGDLDFDFPEGTHAIGRLDNHSEGLLILTTDKRVTRLLFQGDTPHKRVYLVQVKNLVSGETLQQLRTGVRFRVKGGEYYTSSPCEVEIVEDPGRICKLWEGVNAYWPYTWLLINLTEGKFHQVRKMVAAVHHRCKRLIRVAIEDLALEDLQPGEVREIKGEDFFVKLKINQ
jgi:23S rRNA pseudouridine2457 synthase